MQAELEEVRGARDAAVSRADAGAEETSRLRAYLRQVESASAAAQVEAINAGVQGAR